jgi:hypothetical protein
MRSPDVCSARDIAAIEAPAELELPETQCLRSGAPAQKFHHDDQRLSKPPASTGKVTAADRPEKAITCVPMLDSDDIRALVDVFRIFNAWYEERPHDEAEATVSRKQTRLVG